MIVWRLYSAHNYVITGTNGFSNGIYIYSSLSGNIIGTLPVKMMAGTWFDITIITFINGKPCHEVGFAMSE